MKSTIISAIFTYIFQIDFSNFKVLVLTKKVRMRLKDLCLQFLCLQFLCLKFYVYSFMSTVLCLQFYVYSFMSTVLCLQHNDT